LNSVDNARALEAVLARLMGTYATGQLTVSSTGATGTVPAGACAIPIDGGLVEEASVYVKKNPATIEADGSGGDWPVTSAGVAVSVEALQGGPVANRAGGISYRWDPPLAGIEATSPSAGAGLTGGAFSGAYAGLRFVRHYKQIAAGSIDELFRATLGNEYPAAVLAWAGGAPLDGPMVASPGPRTARVGRGKLLWRNTWHLFVITTRLDSEGERRREGEALRDNLLEILFDARSARGVLHVSSDPGVEILSADVFRVTPTSYVDLIQFTTRTTLQRTPEAVAGNPWEKTRYVAETEVQAGQKLKLADVIDDMP
jgi:hypothetical protein